MKRILSLLFSLTLIGTFSVNAMEKAPNVSLEKAFEWIQLAKRRFGLDQGTVVFIEHKLTEKAAEGDVTADELSISKQDAIAIITAERTKFVEKRNNENQERTDRILAEQLAQEAFNEQRNMFGDVDLEEQQSLLLAFEQAKREEQIKKDVALAKEIAQQDNSHTNQPKRPLTQQERRRLRRQQRKNAHQQRNITNKTRPRQSNTPVQPKIEKQTQRQHKNEFITINGQQCRGWQWTVKIGGKNIPVKQINVLPQGAQHGGGASCGYHGYKNGLIVMSNNQNFARQLQTARNFAKEQQFILQERKRGITNQKIKNRINAQNLETFEIHQLLQRFYLNDLQFDENGYRYTILDQGNAITTDNVENIMGESLDIVKIRLLTLQNYQHLFVVRVPGAKATHWFTVVVQRKNGQNEYIVADSSRNHNRTKDQMLATLIDELEKQSE